MIKMDINVSMERMNISSFRRQFVANKANQIPNMLIDLKNVKLQLPDVSTLHMTRGFLEYPIEVTDIAPNLHNPLCVHESLRKYLYFQTEIPKPTSTPYPVKDKYLYNPNQFRGLIQHFFSEQSEFHRTLDQKIVNKSHQVLACYEYSPILRTIIRGTLFAYRKFDILMRTILSNIVHCSYPRLHFIEIPLSDIIYTKVDYLKPDETINTGTIKKNLDPSYYFLVHLMGYLYARNLPHNKPSVPLNDIGYLTQKEIAEWHTDSLFNRLSERQCETIYIILTHKDHAVIYNLGDLRTLNTSPTFVDKVIRQINFLKIVGIHADHADEIKSLPDKDIDTFIENTKHQQKESVAEDKKEETLEKPNEEYRLLDPIAPTPFKPQVEKHKDVDVDSHFMKTLHEGIQENVTHVKSEMIDSKTNVSLKSHTLFQNHMNVVIGGKTIAEHLSTPVPPITGSTLEYLEDKVPDKSMVNSTIHAFDQTYLKHVMMKDICKSLTALNKQGLYITDIKEKKINDKFNKVTDYKISLVDLKGKRHSIQFQLPTVDNKGAMCVNGIQSKMIKQMVNIPICKIGENRVSLTSNYNKTIVQRTEQVAHSYEHWLNKYLGPLIQQDKIKVEYGLLTITHIPLPYDYQILSQKYLKVKMSDYHFNLDYPHRFKDTDEKNLSKLESTYGVYCGTGPKDSFLFWDKYNVVHEVKDNRQIRSFHFTELLSYLYGKDYPLKPMVDEWAEMQILDINIPVIFILSYRYGLTDILKYIKLKYRFVSKGERSKVGVDEIDIKFADGTLIFNRYPLEKSLIASGLGKWDLSRYTLEQLNAPDTYFTLFEENKLKPNYLKGITAFFDFFIDPITEEVLLELHEPTNLKDLIIKAVSMLSDMSYYPASSMRHHRLRGYERFSSFIYNEVTRELANYNSRKNQKKGFSINPKSVFNRIISDQTVMNLDVINPIHELKGGSNFTFSGHNGRTGQSFVLVDRVYAKDARGIVSESTPDSGKVALNAYTSANPRLKTLRGVMNPAKDDDLNLQPSEMLSHASLFMPSVTQDDGKRLNFVGIQLSHYMPCDNGEVGFMRTGYELVIPHRTSDTFASTALQEGKVESIDEKSKVMIVHYKDEEIKTQGNLPTDLKANELISKAKRTGNVSIVIRESEKHLFPVGKIFSCGTSHVATVVSVNSTAEVPKELFNLRPKLKDLNNESFSIVVLHIGDKVRKGNKVAYRFGDRYTTISGTSVKQSLVPLVNKGDIVHKGDILVYNKGFFTPDPGTRQVRMNQGVLATTALIDSALTLEDGSVISQRLGEKLRMSPAHKRIINLLNTDIVHSIVKLGEEVESIDPLLTFEDGDMSFFQDVNEDTKAFYRTLNHKAPKCKYHGYIAEIEIFYACEFGELSQSLQNLVRNIENRARAIKNAMAGTENEDSVIVGSKVPIGTKYSGIQFDENTVIIEFTISESLHCGVGDKIVIGGPNKSVVSGVMEKQCYTESGTPIDVMYGCLSAEARIVNSIYIMGLCNRIGRKLQEDIIKIYFDE